MSLLPEPLGAPVERVWSSLAPFVTRVQWHPSVGSTMDVALQQAHHGAAAGLLVVADEQTAGRGRRGQAWASPAGAGLYFSLLLRPPLTGGDEVFGSASRSSPASLLTLAAGVAVSEGIETATGLDVSLKWPNDLLVGRRKLAGILAEGVELGTSTQAVVLGIGINVNEAAFPAPIADRVTSIAAELGRTLDRGHILSAVLTALARQYQVLLHARYDDVLADWRKRAPSAFGREVEWDTRNGVLSGVTAGLDDGGALLVRTRQGLERVIAGEVRWL
ncbi:MAG: biotin--[acetyl-CoA-carboxylase] ligase [Acidobacteria bacterium]|nr:biotin--[acetyl-CoA-carboxylase] ligase [Acidobacteriota bacterium]